MKSKRKQMKNQMINDEDSVDSSVNQEELSSRLNKFDFDNNDELPLLGAEVLNVHHKKVKCFNFATYLVEFSKNRIRDSL